MSILKSQIVADMKSAMKAKQSNTLKTIRMLLAACKQKEVDERVELSDDDIIVIVKKMIKQRKDSAIQFAQANREDLSQQELSEIEILKYYMPIQLSETEINNTITSVLADINNPSMADMGKLMGILKAKLSSKADMGLVNQLLKAQLSN